MKVLQPTDGAAFLAVLGPKTRSPPGSADAIEVSYRTMFEKSSGSAAFKAINDCINPDNGKAE